MGFDFYGFYHCFFFPNQLRTTILKDETYESSGLKETSLSHSL